MNKPLAPLSRALVSPRAAPPAGEGSRPYRGVAIRYHDPCACDAVRRLEARPSLWNRPPLYLETRRFLAGETPPLPLPNCTAPRCLCRYAHYEERRGGDRRAPVSPEFLWSSCFVGAERRSGIERRNSELRLFRPRLLFGCGREPPAFAVGHFDWKKTRNGFPSALFPEKRGD